MTVFYPALRTAFATKWGTAPMVIREEKPNDATRARMAQIGAVQLDEQKKYVAVVEEIALRRWCVEMATKFPDGNVETARQILEFVSVK